MKRLLFFFILVFGLQTAYATHNRAGEITYRHINGFNYEVTITTYTKNSVAADRCDLTIDWGDQTSSTIQRSNGSDGDCPSPAKMGELIPGTDVRKNVYIDVHSYNSPGVYILSFEDPNRNSGIANIIQSVNVPFYVQSELVISPTLGGNSSPVLLNPPIDDGCTKRIFKHNTGAFDPDGDSLSYSLVECRTTDGITISTTYDPAFVQDSLAIDPITGDLIWDVPQQIGQYNFAIQINEFRKNANGEYIRIGYVVRDLQVDIKGCANQPPVIDPVGPFCVEAGQTLSFNVTATDPDGDPIVMTAVGGPFAVEPPTANSFNAQGSSPLTGTFVWQTACVHVRKQPYYVTFEAVDVHPQPLVDIFTAEITVVAPAPRNPVAVENSNSIDLSWDQSICDDAIGYRLYRRENSFGFIPDDCETGVPEYTGYELIADIDGIGSTTYNDDFELKRGVRYCYMVIAYFEDESESYASVEFCTALPLTAPMLTNVDVLNTDAASGNIDVRWILPPELDSLAFPPPYSYNLLRATGLDGTNFTQIQTLTDTFFTDTGLNTLDSAYRYQVDMFSGVNQDFVGSTDPASSVFLEVTGFDEGNFLEFTHNTPWFNFQYEVFREEPTGSGNFVLRDTAYSDTYRDTGLINGDNYCYRARAFGNYTVGSSNIPSPLINNSQINCGVAVDTAAPCAPVLTSEYICENDSLILRWTQPNDPNCVQDIQFYNVYYKGGESDNFPETPIFQLTGSQTEIVLEPASDGRPLVGCYAVTAVDDADQDVGGEANESLLSEIICVEACPLIEFPNVFSPNADGQNDLFSAIFFKDIRELRIIIYNRWGTIVYETNDGNAFLQNGWDGKDVFTGQDCSEGVYYYVCNYSTLSIQESRERTASGFLHLFR
jgi:gliding motility-associated-like protein